MRPIIDLEVEAASSENDSEISSQVASNASSSSNNEAPVTLDLTLGFFDDSNAGHLSFSSESSNEGPPPPPPQPPPPLQPGAGPATMTRVFSCNYCHRKFYSSQALGGHQNAHKRERTLAKRALRMSVYAESLPLQYGASFRSLGIKAHSSSHHHQVGPAPARPHHYQSDHQQMVVFGRSSARFEQGYLGGVPAAVFVDDGDEAELLWPGSFREVVVSAPEESASSPDLTLKL